jgi:hypothetical protein
LCKKFKKCFSRAQETKRYHFHYVFKWILNKSLVIQCYKEYICCFIWFAYIF